MTDNALPIQGEIEEDIWEFQKEDIVQMAGALKINAEASIVSDMVLLMGDFEMSFEMKCASCSRKFVQTVKLESHAVTEPLENRLIVDLTNGVREDILLALPAYPHCDADPDASECPANEAFPETDAFKELEEDEEVADAMTPDEKPNVWDALDSLKNDKNS